MRYLFFDIECADGYRAICEFGYVIVDETFNVLFKRNLLVDPEERFNLRDRPNQDDLFLTYEESYYKKFYPFDDKDVYDFIKNLMVQKDVMIFGHSIKNDINFLFKDCERYNLELFDFVAYDIQKMLPVFSKANQKFTSLETAYENYVPKEIRKSLLDHRAVDDAMKTMLVFKAMVKELEFSINDFLEACPNSKIHAIEYFTRPKEKKRNYRGHSKGYKQRKQGQVIWEKFIEEQNQMRNELVNKNQFISTSGTMKEHYKELEKLIDIMKENSYIATHGIGNSDYLIVFDQKDKEEMLSLFTRPFNGKMMTFEEFVSLNKNNNLNGDLQ